MDGMGAVDGEGKPGDQHQCGNCQDQLVGWNSTPSTIAYLGLAVNASKINQNHTNTEPEDVFEHTPL